MHSISIFCGQQKLVVEDIDGKDGDLRRISDMTWNFSCPCFLHFKIPIEKTSLQILLKIENVV
jgi:hypothetical protein